MVTNQDGIFVNSPNGLWLREAPGGTQEVELIPDGTILVLLPGLETVDGVEWQQVRTPSRFWSRIIHKFPVKQNEVNDSFALCRKTPSIYVL